VTGVASLEHAGPADVSFLTHVRHLAAARASRAGALLGPEDVTGMPCPVLRAPAPRLALIELLRLFHPAGGAATGTHPSAVVGDGAAVDPTASVGAFVVIEANAVVGPNARLYPFVYVGAGAEIGESSTLYPHVVVRDGVRIGRRVIIHPGAVLGADGFGYEFDGARHRKIPQIGGVLIEDDVEIGANTTIDRSMVGDTVIRRGTKIDNLVQIAHNVEVGADSIVAAQTGVAGSCRLGQATVLGGQVGIADHVNLGDGVVLAAQSGVMSDLPVSGRYLGTPARPAPLTRRIWVTEAHLPELVRRVRGLERRLEHIERETGHADDAPEPN
jgi:UDP-3-O-[3-hydroxymyristoyl] glucosamine N-acyltransferase